MLQEELRMKKEEAELPFSSLMVPRKQLMKLSGKPWEVNQLSSRPPLKVEMITKEIRMYVKFILISFIILLFIY